MLKHRRWILNDRRKTIDEKPILRSQLSHNLHYWTLHHKTDSGFSFGNEARATNLTRAYCSSSIFQNTSPVFWQMPMCRACMFVL